MYRDVETSVDDFAVLFDFWKEGEATEEEVKEAYTKALQQIEDAEFKSTLNKPEDELPAVLTNKQRRRRNGKPGLGGDAAAHVSHVWRKAGLASDLSWITRLVMAQELKALRFNLMVRLLLVF